MLLVVEIMKFKLKKKKIIKLLWVILSLIIIISMVGWSFGLALL